MRRKSLILLLLICFIGVQFTGTKQAKAASCNIILSMEEDTVEVGDAFIVTVLIEGEDAISGVELMLTYDSDALEYLAGSPAVSGEEGSLRISDLDMASDSVTAKYVIKFEAKKAMVSYVKVNSNASIYNENSGQSMSTASNVLAVVAKATQEASNNAYLASLKINKGTLKPEFSPEVNEYNVMMEEEVSKLIISAQAQDSNAKVQVKGADDLQVGENEITIIVTAENGDTLEYALYVLNPEASEEEKEVTEIKESEENQDTSGLQAFELQPITVQEVDGTYILTTYAHFTVEDLTTDTQLPRGYEETTVLIDGYVVTAYQNPEEKNDFVIIYASKEGTEPTFYQYDKVECTLQRLNPLYMVEEAIDVGDGSTSNNASDRSMKVYSSLLIGFVILTILFMGTTVIFYCKCRQKHRKRR